MAAAVVGYLAERGGDRSLPRSLASMVVGTALIYLIGAIWLAINVHVGAGTAFDLGVRPFLLGDSLKLLVAAGLLPSAWWLVGRTRG